MAENNFDRKHGPLPLSYLYVPGNAAAKLAKVRTRGTGAVIVDLEDGVAAGRKAEARAVVADWLATVADDEGGLRGPEIWVRINTGEAGLADISAIFCPALAGVCVPKVSAPEDLGLARARLHYLQTTARRSHAPMLMPLIETARGLLAAAEIARADGVARLQLGEVDLGAELGVERSTDAAGFLLARSQVVLASAAAGIDPPVGPVSVDFDDLDQFRASTLALKRLGFRSRACVHPAQVTVVNEVFAPTDAEVQRARDLVQASDEAVAAGTGVWRGPQGTMVDEAVVRAARRLLHEQGFAGGA
jgi:citrate lyase subunit beta/citryl-CoA lyase